MKYDPSRHQEGTPASVQYAKSMTPGENKKKKKTLSDMREKVSPSDLRSVERKADADLKPYNISMDLGTRHFADRVNDKRNEPEINKGDLDSLVNKVKKAKGQKIKQRKDGEAVLRDKKTKINMPVAIKTKRDGSGKKVTDVTAKTIMRKGDFKTPKSSPIIAYEEREMKDFHEFRKEIAEGGVKSGHKRSVDDGAGLTQKGVDAENRKTGGNLKTAVTTPPSKLDPKGKAAGRRRSFCARSKGWTGDRGKAARRRWNC